MANGLTYTNSIMKSLTLLAVLALLGACNSTNHTYDQKAGTAPKVPSKNAPKVQTQEAAIDLPAQPSASELQQSALKSISAQNADAEFQKLKDELGGG